MYRHKYLPIWLACLILVSFGIMLKLVMNLNVKHRMFNDLWSLKRKVIGKEQGNKSDIQQEEKHYCSYYMPEAYGRLKLNETEAAENYWSLSNSKFNSPEYDESDSDLGVHREIYVSESFFEETLVFEPNICIAIETVAIIIPFRDQEAHLRILLGHLFPILQRQLVRFSVFVVEQSGAGPINKGRLMNTGFDFACKSAIQTKTPYDCFIFHDVDLLVDNDELPYGCSSTLLVVQLLTAISNYGRTRRQVNEVTVGGVTAFPKQLFENLNGYSNIFWDQGSVDEDMRNRISSNKITVYRTDTFWGRFGVTQYGRDDRNPDTSLQAHSMRNIGTSQKFDGLSSLNTGILKVEMYPLFTRLLVDVRR